MNGAMSASLSLTRCRGLRLQTVWVCNQKLQKFVLVCVIIMGS